ncbi:ABC transporter permease [Acuticoccus sp.]|uniref:ABC transporter permease n=1 Tax=Acuticoccus sp. TaxID=1904378 RepID=UPI003B51CEA9
MTDSVAAAQPTGRMRFAAAFARRSPQAVAGLVILALLVVGGVFAPVLALHDPYDLSTFSIIDARLAPGEAGVMGSVHPLGTDDQGRDLWSAILYGLRISLFVAAVSATAAGAIGTAAGLFAGWRGGWTDRILMRIVDIQLSVPAILVALVLLAILGRAVENTIIALVTVQWVYFARTVRASVLVERRKEYVEASRLMGFSDLRILAKHILPNCLGPLSVVATIEFAHAITLEATLSFLGVGLPITEPSLGRLVANGFQYLLNGEWWISLLPGIALLLLIFSLNLVGDRLRELADPRRGGLA